MNKENNNRINLSIYSSENYSCGRSKIVKILWYLINISVFKSFLFPSYKLKRILLKIFGAKVGKKVIIKPGVNIKYPWLLKIGDFVWIGENVWIDNLVEIKIEDNVCISQGAMLLTGNHNYKSSSFDLITGKIILREGTWIGAKSIVCPNVVCKTHSVLSVGSVANNDLDAYSIYQGIPAIKIRERIID